MEMEGPGPDAANDRQWRAGYGQQARSNRQLVAVQRNWDHADQIPQKMVSRQRLGSNRHSLAMICTWGWAEPQALGGSEPCPNHDWMYVRPAGAGPKHVPSAPAWVSSACLMHPIPVGACSLLRCLTISLHVMTFGIASLHLHQGVNIQNSLKECCRLKRD